MGLDVYVLMCKNRNQIHEEDFWDKCKTGWRCTEEGVLDYSAPCEVYYARKFWDLYTPMSRRLGLDNGDYSEPLTKDDIEYMIEIATHTRDYFDSFNTVPALCEILDRFDDATENGMVFIFTGNY